MSRIPYIVSPEWLASELNRQADKYILIDMTKPGVYAQAHLPNAINIDYARLQRGGTPAGLAPHKEDIEALLSDIGLTEDKHVIAYDEEGGRSEERRVGKEGRSWGL